MGGIADELLDAPTRTHPRGVPRRTSAMDLLTLALIGLVGGLITGISPCILPVLPVVFFAGGVEGARGPTRPSKTGNSAKGRRRLGGGDGATVVPVGRRRRTGRRERPARTIGTGRSPGGRPAAPSRPSTVPTRRRTTGAVTGSPPAARTWSSRAWSPASRWSRSSARCCSTCSGLPQDLLRWAGIAVLALLGVGLLVPRFEEVLERPFQRLTPKRAPGAGAGRRSCWVSGSARCTCRARGRCSRRSRWRARPGRSGPGTVVLTVSFALGAAVPLLILALAGRRVAERIAAFRTHQRGIRAAGGALMIALALALAFNLTDAIQRALPGYTDVAAGEASPPTRRCASSWTSAGWSRTRTGSWRSARNSSAELEDCGPAPALRGIDTWLNTPDGAPIDLGGPPGQGRAARLLGVLLHQLPALGPARDGVGGGVPRRRPGRHRRAHPRVRVRARDPQRRRRRAAAGHHVPGRAGQLLRHVDRVPEPVLAGALPDRRRRPDPAGVAGRGRVRGHRDTDPRAAPAGRSGRWTCRPRRRWTTRRRRAT